MSLNAINSHVQHENFKPLNQKQFMKNTKTFAAVATIALLGGFAHRVQGQAYIYSLYSSQTSTVSSWGAGTIGYETGATPEGGSGGTTQDNDSWGGNAHGNNGFGALGQAFVVSQSGTLSTAQLIMAGNTQAFSVELYDLGPAPGNFPSGSPLGSGAGGAPSITQVNALTTPVAAPSGTSLNGGPNLITSTAFTFGPAASQDLVTLNFGAALNAPVNLTAGELYMLSLDPLGGTADNTWWDRGGLPVAGFNTGEGFNADGVDGMQNFEGKSSIRDFDLAITETVATPEPSTIALGVIGASSFLFRRRSK
jgi:hypothetical protein